MDQFDAPHDYLVEGVEGTGWTGFVGSASGETASACDASISQDGVLYLQSSGGSWSDTNSTYGPFLYYEVTGDFEATVQVVGYEDVAYNFGGLMARVKPEDASDGEDWVSIEYFDMYNVGNIVHYADDDNRREPDSGTGQAHPWLQIEKRGNRFFFRTSDDGETWTDYQSDEENVCPMIRDDMDGVTLQVGLWQATYTDNEGRCAL